MKSAQIWDSTSIIGSVLLAFIIGHTSLSNYSSYLLACLIIFYGIYISIKKRSKTASELFSANPVELFGIVTIVLLIINLTNGLFSPLFFFLYFILFLLAFMNSPTSVWLFLIATLLYFIPQASNNISVDTFIKLGSLLLIAPIAYFVGKELERRQLLGKKIDAKAQEIIQEAVILKDEAAGKTTEEDEAIDEIIEEAQSLQKDSND